MEIAGGVLAVWWLLIILAVLVMGPLFIPIVCCLLFKAAIRPVVTELRQVNRNLARLAEQRPAYHPPAVEDEVDLQEIPAADEFPPEVILVPRDPDADGR